MVVSLKKVYLVIVKIFNTYMTPKIPQCFWKICLEIAVLFVVAVQIHLDFKPCQKAKDSCQCLHRVAKQYKKFIRDISLEINLEGRVTSVFLR